MSVQGFLIKWTVSVYTLHQAKHLCTFITTVNNDSNDLASKLYKFRLDFSKVNFNVLL